MYSKSVLAQNRSCINRAQHFLLCMSYTSRFASWKWHTINCTFSLRVISTRATGGHGQNTSRIMSGRRRIVSHIMISLSVYNFIGFRRKMSVDEDKRDRRRHGRSQRKSVERHSRHIGALVRSLMTDVLVLLLLLLLLLMAYHTLLERCRVYHCCQFFQ